MCFGCLFVWSVIWCRQLPRGDDFCAGWLLVDLIEQALRDLEGEIVFFCERAECACHSAAGGVQDGGFSSGQTFGQSCHECRIENRFGMAMRMNQDVRFSLVETNCIRLLRQQVVHELLEQKTARREFSRSRSLAPDNLRRTLTNRGRFEKEDWSIASFAEARAAEGVFRSDERILTLWLVKLCCGTGTSLSSMPVDRSSAGFLRATLQSRVLPALSPRQRRCAARDDARKCRPKE